MSIGTRFDGWVDAGPFTARDLGLFRVVYAAAALLLLPRPDVMADLPDFLWAPPPGPYRLLGSPPPDTLLLAVSTLEALALAFLLLGLFTTAASLAAGVTFVVADGFSNSYGSVHHYVLLGVVPLLLCWAGWGRRCSVDALRRPDDARVAAQWPLRLLALATGVAFATAGVAKLRGGWLDPGTQATRSYFLNGYYVEGRDPFLGPLVAHVQGRWFWEPLDWLTVALELSLLVAAVSWVWFRRLLLVVVAFHVAVLLVLSIAFAANVVAYGAFVRWSDWSPGKAARRGATHIPSPLVLAGAVIAVAAGSLALTGALTAVGDYRLKGAFVLAAVGVAAAVVVPGLRPRRARTSSG